MAFAPTGGWNQWTTAALSVRLSAGRNVIKLLIPGSSGGPKVDELTV